MLVFSIILSTKVETTKIYDTVLIALKIISQTLLFYFSPHRSSILCNLYGCKRTFWCFYPMLKMSRRKVFNFLKHSLRRMSFVGVFGAVEVACCEPTLQLWVDVDIYFTINFYINYILHHYNLLNYILFTLVLYLTHHLMCWLDTSDNCFKHKERSLWILSGMKKDLL